jgi:ribulose kinase
MGKLLLEGLCITNISIANGLNGNPRRVFADILNRRAVSNQIKAVVEFGAAALLAGAEMTDDEFDQAIEAIRQGQITERERRVVAAAVFMMRELCSVPDHQNWEPTNVQIIEFIDSLDKPFRRILQRVSDDVKAERHTLH